MHHGAVVAGLAVGLVFDDEFGFAGGVAGDAGLAAQAQPYALAHAGGQGLGDGLGSHMRPMAALSASASMRRAACR